jgi:hypothetical protein
LGALGSLQHLVRQRNAEATAPRSETPFSGRKEMRTAAAEEKLSRIEVLEEVFGVQESHQRSVYKRKKGKREREREREKRERERKKCREKTKVGIKRKQGIGKVFPLQTDTLLTSKFNVRTSSGGRNLFLFNDKNPIRGQYQKES